MQGIPDLLIIKIDILYQPKYETSTFILPEQISDDSLTVNFFLKILLVVNTNLKLKTYGAIKKVRAEWFENYIKHSYS